MIDKALETLNPLEDPQEPTLEVVETDSDMPEVELTDDGGMVITLEEEPPVDILSAEHSENLANYMSDQDLEEVGRKVLDDFNADKQSRSEWEDAFQKGLDFLGIKVEDRTTPWAGACGVQHPMILEAVVRFQSNAIMEIWPASGPVKTKVIGKLTEEKEKQATRVREYMNYLSTEVMSEYRAETERLLFALAFCGSAFRKVYQDPTMKRPVSAFVPAEDFIMPYGATSLLTAPRHTEIKKMYLNDLKKLQVSGFYREVELEAPAVSNVDDVQVKKDEVNKEVYSAKEDYYTILEQHCYLDCVGLGDESGVALPYVVTVDRDSGKVLSIYRNWDAADPEKKKLQHYVSYSYIPGLGAYGYGLIHLIGGITKGATAILRQLVDAGTLANLPGGLKARGMRIKGDNTPISPGEFRDVDIPTNKIQESIMPLPYKEPSAVLYQLLGGLVDEGRRLGSIADIQIGDVNDQAPVGTTLALLERAMKVMSAVQARLHASLKEEFDILVRLIKEFGFCGCIDQEDPDEAIRPEDFDDRIDVVPVSDPNAASTSQRVMQYQAAIQLSATAPPGIYDIPELHRQTLEVLGVKDPEKIIPDKTKVDPADPVTENMSILNGKPVKAFEYQDHKSHISSHMALANDPMVRQMMGQNPNAQAIFGALMAHVTEHMAFEYRNQIAKNLGVPLPPLGEKLSPEIEANISPALADAAQRLLASNQNQAAQQQAQQQAQDPVLQIQKAEVEIKAKKVQADQATAQQKLQLELVKENNKKELEEKRIMAQAQSNAAAIQQKAAANAAESDLQRKKLVIEKEELLSKVELIKAQVAEIMTRIAQINESDNEQNGKTEEAVSE